MKAIFGIALSIALSCVSCHAQNGINPHTQGNWSTATGSGAPAIPCTAANRGEPYTDITTNLKYMCGSSGWVQIPSQTTPASNNGIANAPAASSSPFAVTIPPNYAKTEAQPWGGSFGDYYGLTSGPPASAPSGCTLDQRWGPPQWICSEGQVPQSSPNRFTSGPTFVVNNTSSLPGFSPHPGFGLTVMNNVLAGGRNFNTDQTGSTNLNLRSYVWTPTSDNGISNSVLGYANGDHIGIISGVTSYGGTDAAQDEGNEDSYIQLEAVDVWEGTLSSVKAQSGTTYPRPCTAPCNVLAATTRQGASSRLGAGLQLIDLTRAYSSSGSTADTGRGTYLSVVKQSTVTLAGYTAGDDWDTLYGYSNAHTTLTQAISNPPGAKENTFPQTNYVMYVASAAGFTTTKPVCIFDVTSATWECETVTAVNTGSKTITLAVVHSAHPTSSLVAQGGLTGYGLSLGLDWVGGSAGMGGYGCGGAPCPTNIIRPVWPVMYNVAGDTAYMFTNSGLQFPGATREYAAMGSGGTVTATVSGGAVTACTASGGTGYKPGGGPPQLTYSVNAGGTPPVLYVVPGSGSLSSCTVANPGSGLTSVTVAVRAYNPYALYPMTHLLNVWNPATGALDGSSLATEPLMGTWKVGDTLEEPHYFGVKYTFSLNKMAEYQPGTMENDGPQYFFGGVFGTNSYGMILANHNSSSLYAGYPAASYPLSPGYGIQGTPYGITMSGAWNNGLWMTSPPFRSPGPRMGAVYVSCTPCSSWKQTYPFLNGQNALGGEDILGYNPSTETWTWTGGASGYTGAKSPYTVQLGPSGLSLPAFEVSSTSGFVSGAVTNWAPYSQTFSGTTTWVPTASPGKFSFAAGQPDPWGGRTATQITLAGGGNNLTDVAAAGNTGLTAGVTYTIQAWMRAPAQGTQVGIGFSYSAAKQTLTTSWAPYCFTAVASTALTHLAALNVPSSAVFDVWNVTVTQGSSCGPYAVTQASQILSPASRTVMPTLSINGGHTWIRHTIVTASLTPSSVAANTCAAQSQTVAGLLAGDHVINRDVIPSFTAGLALDGIIVSAANTASLNFCNQTATAITPPSGTYTFDVEQ